MAASSAIAKKLGINAEATFPDAVAVASEGSGYACNVDPNGASFLLLEIANTNASTAKSATITAGKPSPIGYGPDITKEIAAGATAKFVVAVGDHLNGGKVVVTGTSTDITVKAVVIPDGRNL